MMITSSRSILLLLLSATAVVNCIVTNPDIVLRPADVNAPKLRTLPLSCVATSDGGDLVILRWSRQFGQVTTSVGGTPVTQSYTSSNGRAYTISTILLCDLDFGHVGTYVCQIVGTNEQETFQVAVHIPSMANFQLRLRGVGNCGQWMSTDLSTKLQSVVDHLENNVLNNVCSDLRCSINITNAQFSCANDLNSNGVTFSATIEHLLQVELFGQDASDVVNAIGVWKNTDPSIIVASQSLSVESSCDIDNSTVCGMAAPSGGSPIGPAIGGVLGAVVVVCVVIVVIVLAIVIMQRYGKNRLPVQMTKQDYAHTDFNVSYGSSSGTLKINEAEKDDRNYTRYNPNTAYGASLPKTMEHADGIYNPMDMNPDMYEDADFPSMDVRPEMYEDVNSATVHTNPEVYDDIVSTPVDTNEELYEDIVPAPMEYEKPAETTHIDDVYDYIPGDHVAKM